MNKQIIKVLGFVASLTATIPAANAEVGMGADLVSRYVWRGTDFGDAPAVQPWISYTMGAIEVGAWSSWSISARSVAFDDDGNLGGVGGANENDLYVTYSTGLISVTLTDYFFPNAQESDFFSFSDGDEVHILELSAAYSSGPLSVMGAFNFSGDPDNSFYVEGSYELLAEDDMTVGLSVGAGNEVYAVDADPMIVAVGLNVTKGAYIASYILNPEAETTFLVFGRSF